MLGRIASRAAASATTTATAIASTTATRAFSARGAAVAVAAAKSGTSAKHTVLADRIAGIPTDAEAAANFPAKFLGFELAKDKPLFTPGPLGVSLTTKQAALRDLGSRDRLFMDTVKDIRTQLVQLAGVSTKDFTSVLIQGSGSFAVEAVIQTALPRKGGKFLVLANGAYGYRMNKMANYLDIPVIMFEFPETEKAPLAEVEKLLKANPDVTTVAIVHSETSSGIINPISEVGALVRKHLPNATYFVDAMSSFGGIPINMEEANIDFLVSSANKCIEGTPGFSYAIARRSALDKCKGNSRSLSLDLQDQNAYMEQTGQFRFTPATHSILSFRQALRELEIEGGVEARAARYQLNRAILRKGMAELGFRELLDNSHEGYIITSFHFPKHAKFDFEKFYSTLSAKGYVIYPGKVTKADCFRVGSIGRLFPNHMTELLETMKVVLAEMGIPTPIQE
ncbi:2-aminoethylphosphonate-pyruvate transaminase, variant [Capsaspora owczarzaki ATCC 30864]|nr:2-aminoethylphosphonate-pyruvate transaminase, variant [Capsaspora owczarzaki ATCC 30864]|eukprot:XP_011270234.1 2-aminoethylphosphonate-pyruvate transaminase, variant [Capsaspora owczarzaki ATCC 30864]